MLITTYIYQEALFHLTLLCSASLSSTPRRASDRIPGTYIPSPGKFAERGGRSFTLLPPRFCDMFNIYPPGGGAIRSVKLKSRAAWSGVNGMVRTPRSPGTGIIYNSPSKPFSFVSTWLLFRNIQNGNMSIFLNLDA